MSTATKQPQPKIEHISALPGLSLRSTAVTPTASSPASAVAHPPAAEAPFNFRFDETPQTEKFRCSQCRKWRPGSYAMTVVVVEEAGEIPLDGTWCCDVCCAAGSAGVEIVDAKARKS